MKGYIVTNAYFLGSNTLTQARMLNEEFSKRGIDAEIIRNRDVAHVLSSGKTSCGIKADFAVYLDKDKHLSYLIEKKMRLFNTAKSIELCDDKMMTHIALSDHGIKMPETISSPLCYTEDTYPEFLDTVEEKLGYPMVVKETFGSLGKQVMLLTSRENAMKVRADLIMKPHLYQKFISASSGRDIRIIVIGGKAVACMERVSKTDFRSNIALGGVGHKITPPKEFIATAEKCAKILGLDYCGVDLLDDNGPILCEVNSNAFFTEITKITGVNIASLYAEHIIKEMKKQ